MNNTIANWQAENQDIAERYAFAYRDQTTDSRMINIVNMEELEDMKERVIILACIELQRMAWNAKISLSMNEEKYDSLFRALHSRKNVASKKIDNYKYIHKN